MNVITSALLYGFMFVVRPPCVSVVPVVRAIVIAQRRDECKPKDVMDQLCRITFRDVGNGPRLEQAPIVQRTPTSAVQLVRCSITYPQLFSLEGVWVY